MISRIRLTTLFTRLALLSGLVFPATLAAQGGTTVKPLNPAEVTAMAPKVRSIRAEPAAITLHVGETMSLGKIAVIVTDSSGQTRGRLVGFDFLIKPGEAATAMPRQVTGVRPGTAELTISYPRSSWKRADPRVATKVKVTVVK